MLESRKYVWSLLPLIAAIGCAPAPDASTSPRTRSPDRDSVDEVRAPVEHAHDDDVQRAPHEHDGPSIYDDEDGEPEVARERAAVDAGATSSRPTTTRDAAPSPSSARPGADAGSDARVATEGPEVEGSAPTFDAGAGVLQPDGKTVVYRIPDGTGNKDWNQRDNPIKIKRGMTLRLIDDDKTAKGGGHWLHSFGICPHSRRAIGTGYECTIPASAKTGLQSGLFEHNVANAGGRIYLVVVD